jgi:hypothetical protein
LGPLAAISKSSIMLENSDLEALIATHIQSNTDLYKGIEEILTFLEAQTSLLLKSAFDVARLKLGFTNWLTKLLDENELPQNIFALNFSVAEEIVEVGNENIESVTLSLWGSKQNPDDNYDWNEHKDFVPENNCLLLKDFQILNNLILPYIKANDDYNDLAFLGITNLLILDSLDIIKLRVLKNRNSIIIGSNQINYYQYILGKLTMRGLQ